MPSPRFSVPPSSRVWTAASLPSTKTGRHRRRRSCPGNFSPGCASPRPHSRLHVERTFSRLHAWKVSPGIPSSPSKPPPFLTLFAWCLTETVLIFSFPSLLSSASSFPLPRGFWLEYWISQSGSAVTRARTPQPGQRRRHRRRRRRAPVDRGTDVE